MPKILKSPSIVSKKKKYGHDLSQLLKFSSSCGQLLPVYYDLASPGDRYKLQTEMFTQITDIVSPAMMKMTEHVDWFFVPIQHICQLAGDALYGINDIRTTLLSNDTTIENIIPQFQVSRLGDAFTLAGFDGSIDYQDLSPNIDTDEYLIPNVYNAARLAELLGFTNRLFDVSQFDAANSDEYLNPMLLCAYQKIFYDCFRNTDRTANDATYYNVDAFINAGVIPNNDYIKGFFKLRYRQFGRDFFQITFPKPLIDFGDIGMLAGSGSLVDFNNWLAQGTTQNNAYGYQGTVVKDLSVSGRLNTSGNHTQTNTMNTALLRGMFAVEKLMEITRRAAKHYDAQTLAHFGFEVPTGISGEVYRVGSESSVIQVNEVIAQAVGSASVGGDTITSTVGERGGKAAGYSPKGRAIKFTAPCHGILMAVYSAVPEADYNSEGLDRINQYRTRYDFYIPALDNLGMQPLFAYQTVWSGMSTADSQIQGWQYRYQELKLKYNRCCGSFNSTYENWTVKRLTGFTFPDDFYVNPQYMDSILLLSFQPADGDTYSFSNVFARDPFLHWFKFNVFKSSEMSTFSLPRL